MQAILNAVSWLVNSVELFFNYLINTIKSISDMFRIITKVVNISMITVGTLPSWLYGFATITIAVSIIYLIVGRNTGKSDK